MATDKEVTEIAERFCRVAREIVAKTGCKPPPPDWQIHADVAAMNAALPLPVAALAAMDDVAFASMLSCMAWAAEGAGFLDDAGGLQ